MTYSPNSLQRFPHKSSMSQIIQSLSLGIALLRFCNDVGDSSIKKINFFKAQALLFSLKSFGETIRLSLPAGLWNLYWSLSPKFFFILLCSKAGYATYLKIIFPSQFADSTNHEYCPAYVLRFLSISLVHRCQRKLYEIDEMRDCTHHATSTHLSPFRSLIRVRRCSFISTSRFSTILSMQLSSTRERVFDLISCLQIGHSTLRFVHSSIQ